MENLNAEQVKKALENCENECCDACENCPSPPNTSGGCVVFVMRQSLALINSQEQDKEKLGLLISEIEKEKQKLFDENKRLSEENERLQDEADRYKRYYFNHEYDKFEAEVRADTVRKMQERLGEHFVEHNEIKYGGGLIHKIIDQIAKEMLEGEK